MLFHYNRIKWGIIKQAFWCNRLIQQNTTAYILKVLKEDKLSTQNPISGKIVLQKWGGNWNILKKLKTEGVNYHYPCHARSPSSWNETKQ